jgi:hypothetical protein
VIIVLWNLPGVLMFEESLRFTSENLRDDRLVTVKEKRAK